MLGYLTLEVKRHECYCHAAAKNEGIVVPQLIGSIIGILLWGLLGAVILQFAARLTTKIRIPFKRAYGLCVGSALLSLALPILLLAIILGSPSTPAALAIGFGVTWCVFANFIKDSKGEVVGGPIGFIITATYAAMTIAPLMLLTFGIWMVERIR